VTVAAFWLLVRLVDYWMPSRVGAAEIRCAAAGTAYTLNKLQRIAL